MLINKIIYYIYIYLKWWIEEFMNDIIAYANRG